MSTKIQLTYCGMEGEGATVKLAKQDAARKIEAVLAGYYTPYMIRHGDMIGFIWRDPRGYNYKIITSDVQSGSIFGNSATDDEKEARNRCANHMAQISGSYVGLDAYLTDRDRRDLDEYAAWQERYKQARASGKTDTEAYNIASNRP